MKYSFSSGVVCRTPHLPKREKISTEFILTLLKEDWCLEAIFLSSQAFYHQLIKFNQNPSLLKPKQVEHLFITFTKYYLRMSQRATPFGMFAGCMALGWGEQTIIRKELDLKNVQFSAEMFTALSTYLLKLPAIKKGIVYFPNSTLYKIRPEEWRYYKKGVSNYELSTVEASHYLNDVLIAARDGITIEGLTELLLSKGANRTEALNYINQLIDEEILLSELRPSIIGKPFKNVITDCLIRIQKHGMDSEIQSILSVLKEIDSGIQASDYAGVAKYLSIQDKISSIIKYPTVNKVFNVDLFYSAKTINSISSGVQNALVEVLEVYKKLTIRKENTRLQRFLRNYKARYEERMMPLMEVLDSDIGIGYEGIASINDTDISQGINLQPGGYLTDSIVWNERFELFTRKLAEAYQQNSLEINLTQEDLKLIPDESFQLPGSLSAIFKIIDKQTNALYVEGFHGASAINVISRFSSFEPIYNLCKKIVSKETAVDYSEVIAEVVHAINDKQLNITSRHSFFHYEIPIYTASTASLENQILMSDLFIYPYDNDIYLYSKRLNRIISPRISSAFNYKLSTLPVVHFLGDLQYQGIQNSLSFQWDPFFSHYKFLPRVVYKNHLLKPATWNFSKEDLLSLSDNKADFIKRKESLSTFVKRWKLPTQFLLGGNTDNELLIDVTNDLMCNVFFDEINKSEKLTIIENLQTTEANVSDFTEGQYHSEFIAAVFTGEQPANIPLPQIKEHNGRVFEPGSEWFYYKIYCGKNTGENIIQLLKPAIDKLLKEHLIKKWFFIRYDDGDFHIRLRLCLSNDNYSKILGFLNEFLNPLIQGGMVWKLQIDTYVREIERFGVSTMTDSETLFMINSEAVVCFLKVTDGTASERVAFAVKLIDTFLNCFGYDDCKKATLFNELAIDYEKEFSVNKLNRKPINKKIRELKDLFSQYEFDKAFCLDIIQNHTLQVLPIALKFCSMEASNRLSPSLKSLLKSYIHMFLNRLFISNPRKQELLLYGFLSRYYNTSTILNNSKRNA